LPEKDAWFFSTAIGRLKTAALGVCFSWPGVVYCAAKLFNYVHQT
jgi:hypothetical protein